MFPAISTLFISLKIPFGKFSSESVGFGIIYKELNII